LNIKKIYLIRHGQTNMNLRGVVQGSGVDSSLNTTGQAQAQAFFEAYKHVKFNKVYRSGLKRTHETVLPFVDLGVPYEDLPDLNEISWGVREGMKVDEAANAYYMRMIESWRSGETNVAIQGGESPDEVGIRLKRGLDYILSKQDEGEILICMHGRAMRVMLCLMLNYPLRAMDLFEHQNLCLYELSYTGSMFKIDKYNSLSHLSR
jgi:broad specificity phosphatase PhoE